MLKYINLIIAANNVRNITIIIGAAALMNRQNVGFSHNNIMVVSDKLIAVSVWHQGTFILT